MLHHLQFWIFDFRFWIISKEKIQKFDPECFLSFL